MRRSVWAAVAIVGASSVLGVACGSSESGSTDDGDGGASAGADSGGSTSGGSSGNGTGGGSAQGGNETGGRGGSGNAGQGGNETGGRGGSGNAGQGGSSSGTSGNANGGAAGLAGGGGGMAGDATGGSAGANACTTDCEQSGFVCCGTECVNQNNDVKNCGACGRECEGDFPFCDRGTCGAPVCGPAIDCGPGSTCCNEECCDAGELCCVVPGGPDGPPRCVAPVNDTCPRGCPECPCASPNTPIATPNGARPISELRPGDLVYSVDDDAIVAVPIKSVRRNPAIGHYVLRLRLATGAVLELSGMHPTADGRTISAISPGTELDDVAVVAVEQIPYEHSHTYDILPDSETGSYFAGGVRIGSTLFGVLDPNVDPEW